MSTSTPVVAGVDFVSVPTRDLTAAMDFYGNVLGLPRSSMWQRPGEEPLVEAARTELESRGVSFKGDTIDSGVCHQALFEDPDGNSLDLHHRYAPKKPAA